MTDTLLRPFRSSAKEIFAKSCAEGGTLPSLESRKLKVRPLPHHSKPKRKPSNFLRLEISKQSRKCLHEKAKAAGLKLNKYALSVLLGSDYRPSRDSALIDALLKLNRELTAQGTNLIQIANHLNGGSISVEDAENLLGTLARSMMSTHRAVRIALTSGIPAP